MNSSFNIDRNLLKSNLIDRGEKYLLLTLSRNEILNLNLILIPFNRNDPQIIFNYLTVSSFMITKKNLSFVIY